MLDEFLTVQDLCTTFHCCDETIMRMARSGALPGFKFGRCWFFRKNEVMEALPRLSSRRHLHRDKKKDN